MTGFTYKGKKWYDSDGPKIGFRFVRSIFIETIEEILLKIVPVGCEYPAGRYNHYLNNDTNVWVFCRSPECFSDYGKESKGWLRDPDRLICALYALEYERRDSA